MTHVEKYADILDSCHSDAERKVFIVVYLAVMRVFYTVAVGFKPVAW